MDLSGGVETKLHAISWQGNEDRASFFTHMPPPNEDQQVGPTGCDKLPFDPTFKARPVGDTTGSPSGFVFDLNIPQVETINGLNQADLKKAVVTFPEGVGISTASARGAAACSDKDLRLGVKGPARCPDASKIGQVTVETSLLDETIGGDVYLLTQKSTDPQSGEMFRVAFQLRNDQRGLAIKLPGQVRVNPNTGRVEATFDDNPQLPFSGLRMELDGGPGAPLVLPRKCGKFTTEAKLYSWARPEQAVISKSSFEIKNGCGADTEFKPTMNAGTKSSVAATTSQFALVFKRQEGDQEIESIRAIRLPQGLLAYVSKVELCGEAMADAGRCPETSRIGRVEIAAGPGSRPLWVPEAGKEPTGVYLTGPYKGAPYGLSIKVPAQAGPFDLGTVVVRSALHVDERTAAISSGIDETRLIDPDGTVTQVLPEALPRLLKGVALNQREIRVIVDREGFVLNPTACRVERTTAGLYSFVGTRADVAAGFRARDCGKLDFAPRFSARITNKGRKSTLRSFHPRTKFTVVPRKGDANIGAARVVLPSSTILDQANIGTTCTRVQMAARECPERSIVGYARAWSPLLRKAVEGPVYLAANGGVRPLPDLAAVLDGEIRVVLQGEIATRRGGGRARLQNTFRVVPDAPVTRFVLTMRGGKNRGLLVNSTDLCRTRERGVAVFFGQNGKRHRLRPRIATTFRGCGKVQRQMARRHAAR